MTTGPKLAIFAVALAGVFGLGAAVGSAVGPIDVGGGDGAGVMTGNSVADSTTTVDPRATPSTQVTVP